MDPKSDSYKEHGEECRLLDINGNEYRPSFVYAGRGELRQKLGKVQIYFSDETPYYKQSRSYQNISVIESKDGGDSWSKARLIAVSDVSGTIYLTKGKISGK